MHTNFDDDQLSSTDDELRYSNEYYLKSEFIWLGHRLGQKYKPRSGSITTNDKIRRRNGYIYACTWSVTSQLQDIGGGLMVPRVHDIAATGGLASAVYTMAA
uniref:Uncharacterized protein n=1 Tax=Oryza punctata TaxID=4537 RepID=A0A0E0LC92_ORYPU